MNKKMLIIYAVFALISSCKNYAIKDLEQKTKGQVNGFLDKISDSLKNKITSSGPKVDKVAKKLQEEEMMPGDDPNGSIIALQPVLPPNSYDNTSVSTIKVTEQSGGQQEERKVEKTEAEKEENGKKEKVEKKEEKQVSEKVKVEVEEKKEEQKNTEENTKEKEEREQKRQEEERQKKVKEEERKKKERERQEEEKQRQQQEEKERRQVDDRIKTLASKIDEINENIDVIAGQASVRAQGVIDRITGPIYDDFTDDDDSIRKTWDLEDEETETELGRLLEELSDARDKLRTKLNEGDKAYVLDTRSDEPKLKENVNVGEISSELIKLKSKLEEVKKYLESKDNFETIKGYIDESNDDYE
ncbi:ErpC protein [Borreliella carolinensis]|uniref:ErpC protein n=1 Tax=Borreliella carolinensis TaxID=478174 RepID=UPI003AF16FB9